ncbi:MAG: L,D-transpeptidase [Candidatus Berkiella sp.]
MLKKYIALGVISSISLLGLTPSANARYGYDTPYETRYEQRYFNNQTRYHHHKANYHKAKNVYVNRHESRNPPFPATSSSGNIVKVDLGKLAWGAYDSQGNLVKWGRASGGKKYCPDIGRGCRTVTGTFTIFNKKGPGCKSSRFPVGKGGAPMPYCMHFKGGYAMHGGNVPNYNASHGCVRLPYADAQWLNQNFVRVGSTRVNIKY